MRKDRVQQTFFTFHTLVPGGAMVAVECVPCVGRAPLDARGGRPPLAVRRMVGRGLALLPRHGTLFVVLDAVTSSPSIQCTQRSATQLLV